MKMMEDDAKTLWCGNLSDQVTEELLYELFLQAGPLVKVRIPRDRDGRQRNFAFITYCHEVSVPYAMNLFRGTALFNRKLSLQNRSQTAMLPPPIRCTSLDPSFDFLSQANVKQQFSEMTERLKNHEDKGLQPFTQVSDLQDQLSIAALQGNWSLRHHPYRNDDNNRRQNLTRNVFEGEPSKDEYKNKNNYDHGKHNGKHTHGWRNRNRNNHGQHAGRNKGNGYHRRD